MKVHSYLVDTVKKWLSESAVTGSYWRLIRPDVKKCIFEKLVKNCLNSGDDVITGNGPNQKKIPMFGFSGPLLFITRLHHQSYFQYWYCNFWKTNIDVARTIYWYVSLLTIISTIPLVCANLLLLDVGDLLSPRHSLTNIDVTVLTWTTVVLVSF